MALGSALYLALDSPLGSAFRPFVSTLDSALGFGVSALCMALDSPFGSTFGFAD